MEPVRQGGERSLLKTSCEEACELCVSETRPDLGGPSRLQPADLLSSRSAAPSPWGGDQEEDAEALHKKSCVTICVQVSVWVRFPLPWPRCPGVTNTCRAI